VDFLGLLAGDQGEAYDRVFVDPDQAAGLTHAAALLQMLENGESCLLSKLAMVQGGALAFGEAFLASATGQDTAFFLGSVAEADAEIVEAAAAIVGAPRVLAAEGFQDIHRGPSRSGVAEKVAKQLKLD
jgi:hypothetical protein